MLWRLQSNIRLHHRWGGSDGRGNYFVGQLIAIDVYRIDDVISFQDSSTTCMTCGKDYCSEPELQSNWRLMRSVSSGHHILPTVSVIKFVCYCFVSCVCCYCNSTVAMVLYVLCLVCLTDNFCHSMCPFYVTIIIHYHICKI